MPRLTVYHVTPTWRLPLIEEEGLRTRTDLSDRYGPPGPEDVAAPGVYAHGRRVSAYLHLDHARQQAAEHGRGLVSFTVDPRKAIGVPGSAREQGGYWAAARPLHEWLTGEPPHDLEVHQPVPVRTKHVTIHRPLLGADALGAFAPLVEAVADEDRLSAKALMHLAIIASGGDVDSAAFQAAAALAYRDESDPPSILRELVELDPDKVASAALAGYGGTAPEAARTLRQALESTRGWADQEGLDHGQGLLVRSASVLEELTGTVR
ncbi:MAG TPA: hypothetical protein VHF25_13580 [Nitriliruptorales bacterium]|nr:hypothetical protein [Nitriliruptorales bacterium]